MRRPTVALILVALALLWAAAARADGPWAVDYVSVGVNEGVATGGHSGIRFGDQVFHFERQTGGLLRMNREGFETFRHRYTELENRAIVLSRVSVSEETYRLLLEEFTLRYVVQDQHLRALEALNADRRLLAGAVASRAGGRAPEALLLEGAGFFLPEVGAAAAPPEPDGEAAPALVTLRQRAAAALGTGFLAAEAARVWEDLAQLRPPAEPALPARLSAEAMPPATYHFSRRYRDAVAVGAALDVLGIGRPLRDGSHAGAGERGPPLHPEELARVESLTRALEASLVRLLRSTRPDRGFALLLGMARLLTLDESLRSGRWRFLDGLPADATVIKGQRLAQYPELAQALLLEAREEFEAARARLGAAAGDGGRFPELEWAAMEAAGGHLLEVTAAIRRRRDLRIAAGAPLPARGAVLAHPSLAALLPDALRQHASWARERDEAYAAVLDRLYGYEVFTRNCVTEIFQTIDAALARGLTAAAGARIPRGELAARVRADSAARLGGHVDAAPNFLPAAAAVAVERTWAVSERIEIPSYRQSMLARMYREESFLRVFLRESNTFTSTLYRRAPDDSAFLFFTDDAVPPRPVFGAMNLLTGLAVAAAGLAKLPMDGGDLLVSGLKGAFFSLPELAFFNIRKGSFEHVGRPRPDGPAGIRRAELP